MEPITIFFKRVYFEDGNSFAVASTTSGRRFILEDIANIVGIDINYAMNFVYGEKKDENLKTHPCLIDDWDIIIGEKFDSCHPEYDLLSVFTLFLGEDNNGKRKEA